MGPPGSWGNHEVVWRQSRLQAMGTLYVCRGPFFGCVLSACLLTTVGGTAPGVAKGVRPNIVLVILDTTRGDAFSCYGYTRPTSPHIDELAREGTLFLRASSSSPWTAPSVASMFTGYLPSEHGLHAESLLLDRSRETLAEILGEAGYQTVAFSNNPWISAGTQLDQGFEKFEEVWRENASSPYPDSGARRTNERVQEWFQEERDRSRPFFLMVHYVEPHLPYQPPAPFDARFTGEGRRPEELRRVRMWHLQTSLAYALGEIDITTEQFRTLRTQYDGEIGYVDEQVGALLQILRDEGVYDESFLALTADHGENLGEHELMDHILCLYDTLIRVPLILRYPPALPPGERISRPVQTLDIFPTALEVAGLGESVRGRGLSLTRKGPEDRTMFAQYYPPFLLQKVARADHPDVSFEPYMRNLASVERNGLKFIWSSDGRHELYDIKADPGETRNIVMERLEDTRTLMRAVIK